MGKKYNTEEAAEFLGCSANTLAQWCSAKRIPYYKIGRYRQFAETDLLAFIESRRVEAVA